MLKRLAPAAVACACLMVFAPMLGAQTRDQRTLLTFDRAVEIPAQTLEAGTYEFRLADSRADRHIVQIWNEEGTQLVATLMAVPERRLEAAQEVLVSFATGEPGTTPALRAWFYPGERTGHRFVYPEDQAQQIADRTREEMLAADAESLRPERIDEARFEMVNARGERTRYDGAGADAAAQRTGEARPQERTEPAWQEDTAAAGLPPVEPGLEMDADEPRDEARHGAVPPVQRGLEIDGAEDRARDEARPDATRMTDWQDREDAADQQADVVTQPRRGTFVGTEREDETDREEIFGDDQISVTEQYELTRAQEHLRRLTELTDRLLYVGSIPERGEQLADDRRGRDDRGVVGTTGAVGTTGRAAEGAEMVSLSRAELEELRAHALQAKEALSAVTGDEQPARDSIRSQPQPRPQPQR
jgi:hypothetical protein